MLCRMVVFQIYAKFFKDTYSIFLNMVVEWMFWDRGAAGSAFG